MSTDKNVETSGSASPADDDEDAREFEALIRDIAELKDGETTVEHMDVDAYRKAKRS